MNPRVVGCVGALTVQRVSVASLCEDKRTGELHIGKTNWAVCGCTYGDNAFAKCRGEIVKSVYSTTLQELEPIIGKDRVLILPALFERDLKEITP